MYESEQFQQWIDTSRRKIAVALQSYGEGQRSRDDISMTEELGQEAEQRRRKAREEIVQRGSILQSKSQRERRATTSPSASFDELVDRDGRLKKPEEQERVEEELSSSTRATGIDIQASGLVHRRVGGDGDVHVQASDPQPDLLADLESEQHRGDTLEATPRNQLRLDIPSAPASSHPSESLVDLTPTSEFPDTEFDEDAHHYNNIKDHDDAERVPQDLLSQSGYMSATLSRSVSSSHTEDGEPDFYYAHPSRDHQARNGSNEDRPPSPQARMDVSTAPPVASSAEHVEREPLTPTSDDTDDMLSDADEYVRDVHTPISWSEVGSVVSSNDGSSHQ